MLAALRLVQGGYEQAAKMGFCGSRSVCKALVLWIVFIVLLGVILNKPSRG
jgi:hypothetical protein